MTQKFVFSYFTVCLNPSVPFQPIRTTARRPFTINLPRLLEEVSSKGAFHLRHTIVTICEVERGSRYFILSSINPQSSLVSFQTTVDLVIPAHNEESTIGMIVDRVLSDPLTRKLIGQIIVVNDFSSDATAEKAHKSGALVVSTEEAGFNGPGKGEALWLGFQHCSSELLVTCDADLEDLHPASLRALVDPLLDSETTLLTKAAYRRDPHHEGQRVTTLTALPLLMLYYPHLATLTSPLAGEIALRSSVLEKTTLVRGFGVDVALLIDAFRQGGRASIVEVDFGVKKHRHHSLSELGLQAVEVARAILDSAGALPVQPNDTAAISNPMRLPPIKRCYLP
jgi:glucosyl-3-phosphoglycerate synthase